jgi:AraC-like DNA-binding protein
MWAVLASSLWLPLPAWIGDAVVDGVAELLFLTALLVLWLARPADSLAADVHRMHTILGAVIGLWWALRFLDLFPSSWTRTTAFGLVFDASYWVIYGLVLELITLPVRSPRMVNRGRLWLLTVFVTGVLMAVVWAPETYRRWWPSMLAYLMADLYLLASWTSCRSCWRGEAAERTYGWLGVMLAAWFLFDALEWASYLPEPYRVSYPRWSESIWWWSYFPFVMLLVSARHLHWASSNTPPERGWLTINLTALALAAVVLHVALPMRPALEMGRIGMWMLAAFLMYRCPDVPLPFRRRQAFLPGNQSDLERRVREAMHEVLSTGPLTLSRLAQHMNMAERELKQQLWRDCRVRLDSWMVVARWEAVVSTMRQGVSWEQAALASGFENARACRKALKSALGIEPDTWLRDEQNRTLRPTERTSA